MILFSASSLGVLSLVSGVYMVYCRAYEPAVLMGIAFALSATAVYLDSV